jgi:hypothetical protein
LLHALALHLRYEMWHDFFGLDIIF